MDIDTERYTELMQLFDEEILRLDKLRRTATGDNRDIGAELEEHAGPIPFPLLRDPSRSSKVGRKETRRRGSYK